MGTLPKHDGYESYWVWKGQNEALMEQERVRKARRQAALDKLKLTGMVSLTTVSLLVICYQIVM